MTGHHTYTASLYSVMMAGLMIIRSNIEVHSVIQFLHLKAPALVEIHYQLVEVYRVHLLSKKQGDTILLEMAGQMQITSNNPDAQPHLLMDKILYHTNALIREDKVS